jgi:MoxR-like ATPase
MSSAKTYGAELNALEIQDFLDYAIKQNSNISKNSGKRGTPVCVWGTHGLGKTESIIDFARRNDYTYVYCAPAQFEELGDLHGIPETYDPTPEMPNSGDEYTVYRPPQWLHSALSNVDPTKPGLLILDDFNRAEPRILQGCMQLLQMHALFSWELPPNWQIILTANPEGGDYDVNEMDDAMLTRMLHITMRFDAECWAKWAINKGLDNRGIEFLLTYPQTVNGIRTTARSFTQFIMQISPLKNMDDEKTLRLIEIIGKGTLEDETINKFMHFCKFVKRKLLSPTEILEAKDFKKEIAIRIKQVVSGDGYKRTDLLNTMCSNLCLYLSSDRYKYTEKHKENFIQFCMHPDMQGSMQFKVHHLLSQTEETKPLLRDARLANVVLNAM